jgi:peptidoglycan lytic transglycosylase D
MVGSLRSALTGFALTSALVFQGYAAAGAGDVSVKGTQMEVAAAESAPDAVPAGSAMGAPDHDWDGPRSSQADDLIGKSEALFNRGREDYFRDDLTSARREFDAAVDVLLSAPDSLPDRRRVERRLEEMCDLIYRFDVEKLGGGQTSQAAVFDKAPIDEISHMTFPVDPGLTSRLKSELNQTSSAIPLELADPVLSYVHYFSSERGRKTLLSGFKRSGRYRQMIQRVFAEEGVPQELIYLAQAESGFLPRALSYKLCAGMWQFRAETGYRYQLTRTAQYDDRFDPEKATRAAARYLHDLYSRYGDWYLAMAAYNCGEGAVDRAVERTGYSDYWELLKRHALPKETANYVPIIIAMTIIAKNPQDYGLEAIDIDPPADYDTIRVTSATHLNLVADATMQPVSTLRDMNPALLKSVAPAGFEVHVPKGAADTAQVAIEAVPGPDRMAWRLHHVLAGDTLDSIARAYHLPAERIVSVNQAADSIEPGDVLLIPAAYHPEDNPAGRLVHRHRTVHGRGSLLTGSRKPAAGAHIAAAHHVPAQVLHRRAAVRTANLAR